MSVTDDKVRTFEDTVLLPALAEISKSPALLKDYLAEVVSRRPSADAARNRDMFAKRMTPQQIAQAKEMAQHCEASKYKQCE